MLSLFQADVKLIHQADVKLLFYLYRKLQEAEFEWPTLQAHWGFRNFKVL